MMVRGSTEESPSFKDIQQNIYGKEDGDKKDLLQNDVGGSGRGWSWGDTGQEPRQDGRWAGAPASLSAGPRLAQVWKGFAGKMTSTELICYYRSPVYLSRL